MPVTKTAKRALRASKRKAIVNNLTRTKLEIAVRIARKGKKEKEILSAISLADRSSKSGVIHKNKAARIKSRLSKFLSKTVHAKSAVTKSPKASGKKKK